jgi:lipopolysaccharide export system protein LptC
VIGRIAIGLLVVVAIVGALLLGQGGTSTSLTRQASAQSSDVPGYSARNAEVIETGADGRPIYTLHARMVRQRPNDQRVQVDGPRMTFRASDGALWNVKARAGQIHPDGSNVDLFGDVILDGKLNDTAVTIETSLISFDTRNEVASTHAPVTFDSNGGRLGATGLVANLKDGTLRLESRVHGTFPPK